MLTQAQIDKELAEIEAKELEILEKTVRYEQENKIEFFNTPKLPANPLQEELLNAWEDPFYKIFTYTGGNRIGKTTIWVIIAICVMAGYWLWNHKRIFFPHNKPRKIRIVGQDWEKHISRVVIPALEYWWPKNRPVEKKKNNMGVDAFWCDVKTKSTLEIMSNNQEAALHEGWDGDVDIYDEPPKRDVRVANARGLIDRQGRELFCMTLLKEAWVHQEVINAVVDDQTSEFFGQPDRTVYNIEGDIWSNVGFGITEEGVKQFAKALTEDEKQSRLYGKPSYLSGLVCKNFSRKIHIKERFDIPLDWLVDVGIDIHPRKNQAVLFIATSPRGDRYLFHEIWEHGDGTWVAEQIIRARDRMSLRLNRIIVDPLAKGDANNPNTTFDKIQEVLARYGYVLETATKDKVSGILEINNHLKGPNGEPSLFVFPHLVRTIKEFEGWMYEDKGDDKGKPKKVDDDMMENLYRLLLLNTEWFPEEEEDDYEYEPIYNTVTGY